MPNTYYVIDDFSNLVGPMSKLDALGVAFMVMASNGAYNIYDHRPDQWDDIPYDATMSLAAWIDFQMGI